MDKKPIQIKLANETKKDFARKCLDSDLKMQTAVTQLIERVNDGSILLIEPA
jgi:hypothetical protein